MTRRVGHIVLISAILFIECISFGEEKSVDDIINNINSLVENAPAKKTAPLKPAKPKLATPRPTKPTPAILGLPDTFNGKKIIVETSSAEEDEDPIEKFSSKDGDEPVQTPEAVLEAATTKIQKLTKKAEDCAKPKPDKAAKIQSSGCNEQFDLDLVKTDWVRNQLLPTAHAKQFTTLGGQSVPQPEFISAKCIQTTLKIPFKINYHYCGPSEKIGQKNSEQEPLIDTKPICTNGKYASVVHASYNLVANCLMSELFGDRAELNTKYFFALFRHESGFHLNAISSSRAGGTAQLTSDAIQEYHDKSLNVVEEKLAQSKYRECRNLGKLPRISASNVCDRVSLSKGNPYNNLLYAFNLAANNNRTIKATLAQFKHRFAGIDLRNNQRAQGVMKNLELFLTLWAHNTGRSRVLGALEKVLQSENEITVDDLNESDSWFWKGLKNHAAEDERAYRTGKATQQVESKYPIQSKASTAATMKKRKAAMVDKSIKIEKRVLEVKDYIEKIWDEMEEVDACNR